MNPNLRFEFLEEACWLNLYQPIYRGRRSCCSESRPKTYVIKPLLAKAFVSKLNGLPFLQQCRIGSV
jgi:hypothetical protein